MNEGKIDDAVDAGHRVACNNCGAEYSDGNPEAPVVYVDFCPECEGEG